ncbi:hypothetical protein PV343_35740 [Streptomyces sp. WI03-4A]|uniref:hypothetical protein n=1 Tax=Streptomyces TaxID=1883 RepID=UPI0029ABE9FA|nr:hypothetical protein [Streptomyces sp. WI03-4A]MDX2597564.1 hypothetical protein [Streptomyces sp. WI03-4A]
MISTFVPRHRRRWATALATAAFLVALPGCSESGQKREYATPRSLCGTAVDAAELTEFLPAGKEVSTTSTTEGSRASRCTVAVDGKRVVYAAQQWWNDMSVLEFARGLTLEKVDQQTDDGRFAYSANQAFGKTEGCRSGRHEGQVLYTALQATRSEHEDAAAMKKLITSYTKAVERSGACR